MLQRRGLVDAVMSQDVDAIMFGSNLTLRDWSKEASKHNKAPTHVNALDLPRIKQLSGLDPAGMILVALLSGGDYDEAGVPGIGSTLACEIARAGFGTDLLDLMKKGDETELQEWRERLQFELETNESGYFKMKRKSLKIPDTFPDRKILSYYTNPSVTPEEQLVALEQKLLNAWESELDIQALRNYVGETFEWMYKPGAWKFVRVMAPALLANRLQRGVKACPIQSAEQITERRKHLSSDGIPELRITVVPAEIVGLDLDAEEDSPEYLESLAAEDNEDVAEGEDQEEEGNAPASPSKRRKPPPWMPDVPEKMWVAQAIVEVGAHEHVERWRQIQREIEADPKKFAARKCRKQNESHKEKADASGMQAGALLNYLVSSKPSKDKAEPAVTSILPSSPRPKANTSARRAPQTPTKMKSTQPQQLGSPKVMDYFKSTKNNPRTRLAEEMVKHSNRPTVSRARDDKQSQSLTILEVEHRVVDSSKDVRRNQVLSDSVSLTPVESESEGRARLTVAHNAASLEGSSFEEPITILSSPIATIQPTEADEECSVANTIPSTVTQRKRRKPVAQDQSSVGSEPAKSPSPVRPKRPIASFFAPYLTGSQRQALLAKEPSEKETDNPEVTPLDPSTGLKTGFSSPHTGAVPRPSLPGTWREVGHRSEPSSELVTSGAARVPRVSVVDLTGS